MKLMGIWMLDLVHMDWEKGFRASKYRLILSKWLKTFNPQPLIWISVQLSGDVATWITGNMFKYDLSTWTSYPPTFCHRGGKTITDLVQSPGHVNWTLRFKLLIELSIGRWFVILAFMNAGQPETERTSSSTQPARFRVLSGTTNLIAVIQRWRQAEKILLEDISFI